MLCAMLSTDELQKLDALEAARTLSDAEYEQLRAEVLS